MTAKGRSSLAAFVAAMKRAVVTKRPATPSKPEQPADGGLAADAPAMDPSTAAAATVEEWVGAGEEHRRDSSGTGEAGSSRQAVTSSREEVPGTEKQLLRSPLAEIEKACSLEKERSPAADQRGTEVDEAGVEQDAEAGGVKMAPLGDHREDALHEKEVLQPHSSAVVLAPDVPSPVRADSAGIHAHAASPLPPQAPHQQSHGSM